MEPHEYQKLDATELANMVRGGDVSADELETVARQMIGRIDPSLNSVVHRFDVPLQRGESDAAFVGVPFLMKDMLDLEDTPVSYGARLLENHRSVGTGETGRRILESGVRILGRTNMSELGLLPNSEPKLYGPCRNPWSLEHSPGGSSGGSAAAVAAGIVPMAHAGDGGGSIRIPASACGIFGLKPSRGRNPSSATSPQDSFVVYNVVSRSVRDSARFLDCTLLDPSRHGRDHGGSMGELWTLPAPQRPYGQLVTEDPKPLTIAYSFRDAYGRPAHPQCQTAITNAAKLCESLGHNVEEGRPKFDPDKFNEAFKVLWATGAGYFIKTVQKQLQTQEGVPLALKRAAKSRSFVQFATSLSLPGGRGPLVEPMTTALLKIEQKLTPSDLWFAWNALREIEVEISAFYQDVDVWLSPVLASPPMLVGAINQRNTVAQLEDQLNKFTAYTPLANTTGYPAMSVPLHWTPDGLPIGSQFMASLGHEDTLFQLAGQLERAQPWADRRPPAL